MGRAMELSENIRDLIQKYDRPGPRYTSYPTAPHFSEDIDREALIQACCQRNDAVSLYVHIPFCESNCWFCGCNTIITTRHKQADQYLDLLEKEVSFLVERAGKKRIVSSIHLGGGTPNFLSAVQILRLFSILHKGFELAQNLELSVELAPNYLHSDQIDALASCGLTRASFGIQDLNPKVQKAINRIQSQEVNRWTMDQLRSHGIQSINIDLIYGLPYQTETTYRETLDEVCSLNPDRFAVFNYAHVPHLKPYQKRLEKHPMPAGKAKIELLLSIIQILTDRGYRYIGMDHFAKPEDELSLAQEAGHLHRNFQGYTVQEEAEVIALGISSISETPESYRQNYKTLADYKESLNNGQWPIHRGILLTREDQQRRDIIRNLMCNLQLNPAKIHPVIRAAAESLLNELQPQLRVFEKDGLVRLSPDGLRVTETGRLFLRNIAMQFDAYLDKGSARYSRTV